jgi:hypothetical protein
MSLPQVPNLAKRPKVFAPSLEVWIAAANKEKKTQELPLVVQ